MFEKIRTEKIENLGEAHVYAHSTGLKLIYIENKDRDRVFAIGFNTLPENDKGIPHIVEHCVLCGSENYRVKDPFNILDKGSIHTYLNALTYGDKTVYPIASTNEADFKTLMRVYLDAVFRPLMYKNEGIFRQEGWHSDSKEYNGIVLNEMKGAYSSPDALLSSALYSEMFKGSGYGFDSGGKPEDITKLSYEEFLDFHKKHYHPSNAVIYIYGDIDINNYINMIDGEFLSGYGKGECLRPALPESHSEGTVRIIKNAGGKNILSALFDTGASDNYALCTLMGILSSLWCYTEGGNIKKALIDAGLGDKTECIFDDSNMFSAMEISVQNSDQNDIEKFREVLNSVFADMAENGVDEYKLRGVINSLKFYFKEEDFGYKPKGLFYGMMILDSFLKGREDFDNVRIDKLFEEIEKIDIKEVVRKYFLNKGLYGILLTDGEEEAEADKPDADHSDILAGYQNMPDDPVDTAKLTSTRVSDISERGEEIPYEKDENSIFVPLENGDIMYMDIYFDLSDVNERAAISAYRAVADIYDESIANDIDYYLGGLSIEITTLRRGSRFMPVMAFKLKFLKENIKKAEEIFKRIMSSGFEDTDRLERLTARTRQELRLAYAENGNIRAVTEAMAGVNSPGKWSAETKGTAFFEYLSRPVEDIQNGIMSVRRILRRRNAFFAAAGAREDKELLIKTAENALSCLDEGGELRLSEIQKTENKFTGIVTKSSVYFNACAFPLESFSGTARVAQQIIAREYIWDNVRLRGGAYGGGCVLGRTSGYMYSYRDPELERTFEVFRNAGKYLCETKYSQSDIDRFIIGTVNDIDRPEKKQRLTGIAMKKAFMGESEEKAIKRRKEILSAVPKAVREYGSMLMSAPMEGLCSVGPEEKIKQFKAFKELHKID